MKRHVSQKGSPLEQVGDFLFRKLFYALLMAGFGFAEEDDGG